MSNWKARLSDIYAPRVEPAQANDAALPSAAEALAHAAPTTSPTPAPSRTLRLMGRRSVSVTALEVAPDGKTLVVAHADCQVRLLRAASGLLLHSWSLPGEVHSLALSDDGRWLAVAVALSVPGGRQCGVQLFNLRHGTLEQSLQVPAPRVQCLRFDPGARLLAVAAGASLGLWDPWSGHPKQVLRGHAEAVSCSVFSPDGQWLVSGDVGGTLRVWQVATGQGSLSLQHQGELSSLALSRDGAWLAWGARDGTVLVSAWGATPRLDRIRQIEGQGLPVAGLRFSADDRWLVIGKGQGSGADGRHGMVRLWDTVQGSLAAEHAMEDLPLACLAASPDGRWLAVGSPSGEVRLVASDTGHTLRRLPRTEVGIRSLALSPDGQWLASGRDDGQVSVWQPQRGELLREMNVHRSPVTVLGFSADGHWWASGAEDGTVVLWGRGTAHPLRVRPGLRCLTFCPRSRWLALAGDDGTVALLPLQEPLSKQTPQPVQQTGAGIVNLAFSAHGELLCWADATGRVSCWDPLNQQLRSRHALPIEQLHRVALSMDHRWLAAAARDGSVLLWDMVNDRTVWRLAAPHAGGAVSQLLFDEPGRVLHLCGHDGAQSDWDVACGQRLGESPAPAAHYACLGLVPQQPSAAWHAQALAADSIQLLVDV